MNVVVSPGLRTNSAATPSPCRPSGKRLTSETFMPCASKIAPRPSRTTWWGRRGESEGGRPGRGGRDRPRTRRPPPSVSAGVVEGRPEVEAEADRPAHRPHYPDDLVDLSDLARALNRHEVHDFADALVAKKARHQDVAVRHVHLFVLRLVETGDAE